MLVRITQEMIDLANQQIKEGQPRTCCCVLAKGLTEAFGLSVEVTLFTFVTSGNAFYNLTREMIDYRVRFDCNQPISPRDFEFDPEVQRR